MHRVALERIFLERKLAQNPWRAKIVKEIQENMVLLLQQGRTYEQCREEYLSFTRERREAFLGLLKGATADYTLPVSAGEKPPCEDIYGKLRVVLGGLFHLASLRTCEALLEFAAVFCLLELPYAALQVVLQGEPRLEELVRGCLGECLKNGLPFSYRLSLRPEGRGTFEEQALREYEEGLKEENVLKTSCLMKGLRNQPMDYLQGPPAVILALVYYCDRDLFARLVSKASTPAFINLICQDPEYAFDLELLWKIAEGGGLWARVEVFHHLLDLMRSLSRKTLSPAEKHEATVHRAFRRVISVYLGRALILLLKANKPGLLGYILDNVSALWLDPGDSFLAYFLGKYVGRGISLCFSEGELKQELTGWEPGRSNWGLMYLLYGTQEVLQEENPHLLHILNKMLLRKWFGVVWKSYRHGVHSGAGTFLPFTALDLAVGSALANKWRTRERSVRFLKGVCRRLSALEGIWFESTGAEEQRKKALYAGILAHARAWTMLPAVQDTESALPALDFILEYIADQRNWEQLSGIQSGIEMPTHFVEIDRAYRGRF